MKTIGKIFIDSEVLKLVEFDSFLEHYFPTKNGMERCVIERIFPDVSNDHSAFVLRFQQSNVCYMGPVDAGTGFVLYCRRYSGSSKRR